MNVAILSESAADEAAIRILADAILEQATESPPDLPLRSRGWPSVLRVIPSVLRYLHYRTNAEAFIVVADSDDSSPHERQHETAQRETDCRLCLLRSTLASELHMLTPIAGRPSIKTAVGLAVPAIEAWFQCGLDSHVNEATWARSLMQERITYTRRSLKLAVYGTERPTLDVQIRLAIQEANRLAGDLAAFEQNFPNGFGTFATEVRHWLTTD
jgi:hypothetical protein